MPRARHPSKDIEDALRHAEDQGWRVSVGGSHAWGRVYCPYNDTECRCGEFCITSIWSTPRNAVHHARALRRVVDHCSTHRLEAQRAIGTEDKTDGLPVHLEVPAGRP